MTVAIAVQAHPARTEMAEKLAATLKGTAVFDPDPSGRANAWRTYRECLTRDWGTTHLLVVQDDADPCAHLEDVVETIAASQPEGLVCLYVGGMPHHSAHAMMVACERGQRYVHLDRRSWVPLVATLWERSCIPALLEWVEEQSWSSNMIADDETVGRATRALGIDVRATVPSLVEHPDDMPSLFANKRARNGRNPARCAAVLIDADCDAREYDWTSTVDTPVAPMRRRR